MEEDSSTFLQWAMNHLQHPAAATAVSAAYQQDGGASVGVRISGGAGDQEDSAAAFPSLQALRASQPQAVPGSVRVRNLTVQVADYGLTNSSSSGDSPGAAMDHDAAAGWSPHTARSRTTGLGGGSNSRPVSWNFSAASAQPADDRGAVGVALPAAAFLGAGGTRIVGRDLVDPPLDIQAYPSPLSSFRHYTTDLKDETLITVSDLPEGQRVRIAAMDVYDGTTFGMSDTRGDGHSGYIPVETTIPGRAAGDAVATVSTTGMSGPWVPVLGTPSQLTFSGATAGAQKDGLFVDTWANAALTTGPTATMSYDVRTTFAPAVRDEDLSALAVMPNTSKDTHVPDGIVTMASDLTQNASTSLGAARAIEHHLSTHGYYLNENTQFSRPGVRADRLERMLSGDENLIGDDQQYTALMALMLHQLGINARVVMGAYPEGGSQGGAASLRGSDIRAWVEVEFEGGVWAVFDPTPPRDHTPQTQVPEPRSVPRPQVLQPPEPPEAPAELPPTTRDQNSVPVEPPTNSFPWGVVAGVAGGLLLLLVPPLAILAYKAARRRHRRRSAAANALIGSWDEVVDLAADSGLSIEVGRTRQETAWSLASQWNLGEHPGDPFTLVTGEVRHGDDGSTDSVEIDEAEAGAGRYVIDGWSRFGDDVPAPVVIARYADIASFASNGASRDRARDAWAQVRSLRTQVSKKAGFLARVRRALSLRSLRMRRKLRLSASIARTMDEEKKA